MSMSKFGGAENIGILADELVILIGDKKKKGKLLKWDKSYGQD